MMAPFKFPGSLLRPGAPKFHSPKITLGAILALNILTTANLVTELTIDLETTSMEVMLAFWASGLTLLFIRLKWPQWALFPAW